jgi:hypothetical protein
VRRTTALLHRCVALAVLGHELHAHGLVLRRRPVADILSHVQLLLVAAAAEHRGVALGQLEQPVPAIVHCTGGRKGPVAAHERHEAFGARQDLAGRIFFGVEHHAGETVILRGLDRLAGLVGKEVAAHLLHQFLIVDLVDHGPGPAGGEGAK